MTTSFDFEQPIADIEDRLEKIRERLEQLESESPESAEDAERDEPDAHGEADGAEADADAAEDSPDGTGEETQEPAGKENVSGRDDPSEEAKDDKDGDKDAGLSRTERKARDIAEERVRLRKDLKRLTRDLDKTRDKVYKNLTPWQRVQIARHLERPHLLDYVRRLFTDWTEVHGDRAFADDKAMVCGYGMFGDQPCAIVGQQKGTNTRENVERNFGMAHPEGYRKALRVMKTAHKFRRPIVALIDTPGAFPGIGAEERGIAEAIARNIKEMFTFDVPVIVVIIGEGASGGAIGIGVGDAVMMLENSWYTVISPEGCASILWRDAKMAPTAAEALKLTGPDLMELGVVDEVIPEPLGGAHRDPQTTVDRVREAIGRRLAELQALPVEELRRRRFERYRHLGRFNDAEAKAG